MPKHPFVSIIIITMNHERFIEQACLSAMSQTYPHYEIIFLDNASRDKTYEIAEKTLSKFDKKYKLIKNTEAFGVAKNLNILVSHSAGDYISILSGDDWYTLDNLEEKIKFIEREDVDFILTDGYKYYENEGKTTDAYLNRDKKLLTQNISKFFHLNVSENRTVNVGTFVKRQLLLDHPFDENINTEDWDMNLRLTSNGYKLGFLDKKLFYYRILSTSLSRNWRIMKDSYQKVTDKYITYIQGDKNLYKKYKLKLLQFKYEILISEAISDVEREKLKDDWRKEKYRTKYSNPVILFFKLLISRK